MPLDLTHLERLLGDGRHRPDVIVDMSNVCRSRVLDVGRRQCKSEECGHLERLTRVLTSWRADVDDQAGFLGVADTSLRSVLCTEQDRITMRGLVDAGLVIELGYADPEILTRAQESDAWVLSGDGFKNVRRLNEWVAQNSGRFVWWGDSDGSIRFHEGLVPVPDPDLSRAEESDEFRNLGIKDGVMPALTRHWRCPAKVCSTFYPVRIAALPDLKKGKVLCPHCGTRLNDVGPRGDSVDIKVAATSGPVRSLILENDESATLGRGASAQLDLRSMLTPDESRLVSRLHAEIRYRGGQVEIKDLGSSNGSELLRWNSALRSESSKGQICSGEWLPLGRWDRVILGGVASVRRSGRKFAVGSLPSEGSRLTANVEQTRFGR